MNKMKEGYQGVCSR